jgi:acyl carrier protein
MADPLIETFSEGLGVPAEELNDDTTPENTRAWTSLAAMNLVALLEENFDVELSTTDIMRMRSIGIAREVLRAKGVTTV